MLKQALSCDQALSGRSAAIAVQIEQIILHLNFRIYKRFKKFISSEQSKIVSHILRFYKFKSKISIYISKN